MQLSFLFYFNFLFYINKIIVITIKQTKNIDNITIVAIYPELMDY